MWLASFVEMILMSNKRRAQIHESFSFPFIRAAGAPAHQDLELTNVRYGWAPENGRNVGNQHFALVSGDLPLAYPYMSRNGIDVFNLVADVLRSDLDVLMLACNRVQCAAALSLWVAGNVSSFTPASRAACMMMKIK